jgi:tRNA-splicing ligase RtcB
MQVMDDGRMVVFGEHEDKVLAQLRRGLAREEGSLGVECADGHFGYSVPIGGVLAYREHVSPAAVGYDIGCGNLAVATNILATGAFKEALPGLMDRIFAEISFGMERGVGHAADHPVIDKIREAEFEPQRKLLDAAAKQLGTVGGGNHYVDLFEDANTGRLWIGVHFGSRGFGHRTATGFLAMAQGMPFDPDARRRLGMKVADGEMEAPPDVLRLDSNVGYAYMAAMRLAGEYAYAGREVVVRQVLDILGAEPVGEAVHNHHNFAWMEEHSGEAFCVIRKGATPAFPGQKGFVGATMDEPAVILEGVESDTSRLALFSTVHGAGRQMSRTKAAGKSRKRQSCNNRDCDYVQKPHTPRVDVCPECGGTRFSKRWVKEVDGEIDWAATLERVKTRGVELRGANAEEAPGAYKRLDEVLAEHDGTVRILHRLHPIGVAMAPGDVVDPYKD